MECSKIWAKNKDKHGALWVFSSINVHEKVPLTDVPKKVWQEDVISDYSGLFI